MSTQPLNGQMSTESEVKELAEQLTGKPYIDARFVLDREAKLKAERDELFQRNQVILLALKKAHSSMNNWFSSEYTNHPDTKQISDALYGFEGTILSYVQDRASALKRVKELSQQLLAYQAQVKTLTQQRDDDIAAMERMREALQKHGKHEDGSGVRGKCSKMYPPFEKCNCGLEEAISTPPTANPPRERCDAMEKAIASSISKFNEYLQLGGLFNPEIMEHDKVCKMILDARFTIRSPQPTTTKGREVITQLMRCTIHSRLRDLESGEWSASHSIIFRAYSSTLAEATAKEFAKAIETQRPEFKCKVAELVMVIDATK